MNKYKNQMKTIMYIFICSLLFSNASKAQDCEYFFESMCIMPTGWDYEINTQSVNVPMFKGQSIRISAVFYKGYEYSVCFCADEALGNIQYNIISPEDNVRQTVKSDYYGNMPRIEFVTETTLILLIEVTVMRTSANIDPQNKKCVGIIIGQKETTDDF